MKDLKNLILILGIFLISNNLYSQTQEYPGGPITLPLKKYKAIKAKLSLNDSIIYNQVTIINYQDSIMKLNALKFKSYESEINSKNIIIDTLNKEYRKLDLAYTKEKKNYIKSNKFWLGVAIGFVINTIIYVLAK